MKILHVLLAWFFGTVIGGFAMAAAFSLFSLVWYLGGFPEAFPTYMRTFFVLGCILGGIFGTGLSIKVQYPKTPTA